MIIPVRCISCGAPIAGKWEQFNREIKTGKKPAKILDALGVNSYCCRSVFLTHVDLIEKIAKYKDWY
ncbi:MAG: DNA-directed RNA polymerase subunit N [Candidatus Omnitrophica bacterium]|nr:DNA-directed RNA polymerase subunit N [Candidatus Omnitrophota bacterium]